MSSVVVSIEGINFASGYVPREMSVYFAPSQEIRHYFFKSPGGLRLSENDKKTLHFVKHRLGGLGLDEIEGALEYHTLFNLLHDLRNHTIFVVGSIAQIFVQRNLPGVDVRDLQTFTSFKYPKTLPYCSGCGTFAHENARYCSYSKLLYLRHYMVDNSIFLEDLF